jgi:hypothetical protein
LPIAKVAWCASFELGCKFDNPLKELIFERIVAASRSAV